jgi:TonB family protein
LNSVVVCLFNFHASYILFDYNLDILYSEYYHERIIGLHSEVDTTTNIKASFPGGQVAFVNYIMENFKYPQRCLDYGISGNVLLKFRIDTAGRIAEVSVVEQTPGCIEFNIEAINVLKKSPRWTPGMNKGVLVDSWRELPLNISVDSRNNRKKQEIKIR